ncbi:MAG: hypothetical protein KKB50_05560 [Planctomycetes bacterium]|nr:hypothetical protein [Planctomycetota bacterium]
MKNGLLLVMLIVVVGVAGWFFTRAKKGTALPTKGFETHWMCEKCHRDFKLTPAEYQEWLDSKDKLRRDPNFPARVVVFWCPDCKAYSVVRAQLDPTTDKLVIERDSSGNFVPLATPKAPAAEESEKPPQ